MGKIEQHIIEIDKNDSIVDILIKISAQKSHKIILSFPFGHGVLHNYLSLKIIQTKTRNKDLLILTNDKTSKKIGKLLGIKYAKNHSELLKKDSSSQQNILKQNYTFTEYALFEIKQFFGLIKGNILVNKKVNSIHYSRNKHRFLHKNIFLALILISVLIFSLLIYIFYFAINKTTIEITPEINIKTKSRNYTYIETTGGIIENEIFQDFEIPIEKIHTKISLKTIFNPSGIKQKNENIAKGEVTLYNLFPNKISLLKDTGLQTQTGIQFTIPNGTNIPAASKDNSGKIIPGEKKVTIYGQIKLLNGNYSGEQSNIGTGVLLTIPKLGEDADKIFAKSTSVFSGGSNDFIKTLTRDDIINSKKIIDESLEQKAIQKIKTIINERNTQNNIHMEILPVDNIYKFTNKLIEIPEHLQEGDEIESFQVHGEIEISSYLYNTEIVRSRLKKIINDSNILSSEKIDLINSNSLRISHIITRNDLVKRNGAYKYLDSLDTPLKIKATTEIEYYVSKNFENKGDYFNHKLKSTIAGMKIEDAEQFLINQDQINNIHIDVQPFFLKTISKITDNIIIKVVD